MKTYKFECWYRYGGGDEKEFEIFEVKAESMQEAEILLQKINKGYFYFKRFLISVTPDSVVYKLDHLIDFAEQIKNEYLKNKINEIKKELL